ncbi:MULTISPECIES: galactose oxidase [Dyadobacter]|uniref:Galactose oxidase n=1 Tax=Dyadobacter chenhuakuii TaxID=2909339 RepID=A0A9X1TWN3_9BACT|nr:MULTISPECIES: galactose oxidase [Dyadobacter]MCE7071077.1 galactose oxidase [Dyadobacter sp. CY327]MCF2494036.1 galactose oxidase [Dyadobacter chenhuakuii]MCF2501277.1 galactose oxidase [Dyadobacter chenhuakuii]MCF2518281.1 galactose oxidase [Dyadobacter sp. CY351]USJ31165.1 galactose oxidase [Dyadobacter chenhuakuii]
MFNTLKKTSLALLVASTALLSFSCSKDDPEADKIGNWYRAGIPNFGGSARARAVSFVIGNKGYIGTGLTNETVQRVKDFWSYDATTKIWSQVAPFEGSGRNDAVAFVVNGKAYVGTGFDGVTTVDGGYKKDFYQYDPATNKWTKKADYAGGTRQYATAFVADNRAYVGLGWNGSGYYQDFYEYNVQTDKWTEVATFTGGKRRGALAFTVGGKAYVGFGQSNSGAGSEPKDLYSFDPAGNSGTGAWTRMETNTDDKFTGRTYALPLVINDKAYIVGGNAKSDTWEYTPGTNTWTEVASFEGGQRGFAAGFAIGNTGYLGTGGNIVDDFWAFDPTAAKNDDDNL